MSTVAYVCDYAKFKMTCSADQAQKRYEELTEALMGNDAVEYKRKHVKITKLKTLGRDLGVWYLECWGTPCATVVLLDRSWFLMLERFDMKATLWDTSAKEAYDVGLTLAQKGAKWNVQTFNKPSRSGLGGTGQGGYGWAMGSHKSDLRVSCYSKEGAVPGLEFQVHSKMLERFKARCLEAHQTGDFDTALWSRLRALIEVTGTTRVKLALEGAGLGGEYHRFDTDPATPAVGVREAYLKWAEKAAKERSKPAEQQHGLFDDDAGEESGELVAA